MTARRVLLIDDDKLIHTVVRAALGKHGSPEEVAQRIPSSPSVGHLSKPSSPGTILGAIQGLLGDG